MSDRCPCCQLDFDVTNAAPSFLEPLPAVDSVVYILCPDCHAAYTAGSADEKKSISNQCFINFKLCHFDAEGVPHRWAVTTVLALLMNGDSLAAALENGHGLPREIYLGLVAGRHELLAFPGGGIFLISSSDAPGVHDDK